MNLHPSGPSQVMCAALANHWKLNGFLEHVERVEAFYLARRDAFLRAAEKHLAGLATWIVPKAGMFFWIKVEGVADSKGLVKGMVDKKVLMVPGFVGSTISARELIWMANDEIQFPGILPGTSRRWLSLRPRRLFHRH